MYDFTHYTDAELLELQASTRTDAAAFRGIRRFRDSLAQAETMLSEIAAEIARRGDL